MTRASRTDGKTSEANGGNVSPAKGRKITKTKRRIAPTATRVKRRSVSGPSQELKDARAQQAATAEILKVIASSPSDVQPVFEAIVRSAAKLFEPCSATITILKDDKLYWGATAASISGFDVDRVRTIYPVPFDRDRAPSARAMLERRIVEIPDVAAPETPEFTRNAAAAGGFRSITFAPLVDREQGIGTIIFSHPQAGFRYSEPQLAIIQTFADQAVIAIQNARLFNETQEALERQTATAEILRVIASSPSDVQPVFDVIVERAVQLCGARMGRVYRYDGELIQMVGGHGLTAPGRDSARRPFPRPASDDTIVGRVMLSRRPNILADLNEDNTVPPLSRQMIEAIGARSQVTMPMLLSGTPIGAITLSWAEPRGYNDHQIALLQTFADQAVIAIGNVRLFNEVRQRTEDLAESLQQQTATSEILSVISSSPSDLAPVFDAMLGKAMDLCGANFGVLNTFDGQSFRTSATYGLPPAYDEYRRSRTLDYGPETAPARLLQGEPYVEFVDLLETEAYRAGEPNRRALVDIGGARSLLAVPLLKEERVVGNVMIFRQDPARFSDKQIALLKQFAAQAVIAIENARLLNELRQRTSDLSRSLADLHSAQDRLIQTEKLASLGQLTAGIAHEIKNPLNFVNNFSALSAELTDELNDVLKLVAMDGKVRGEVDGLTGLLKDNLEKVVQHGKRADSIVKNMLLHSREGSGEERLADINALLNDSLNLAYHGARAETPGFNITLERDFDAEAGAIESFPQEITRAFLNLISNGFYAATKRKAESRGSDFEPVVSAATRNLGDCVEVRIRDNGTGVPAEVKEKMFNPFFTTKPAGEGTGLGLSISHDIIVKQHGGRIDVETEPGQFTEFKIVLPRTSRR